MLAEELASYGPRVKVVSPPEPGDVRAPPPGRRRRLRGGTGPADRVPGNAVPARHGRKRTSEDQLTRMLQLVPFLVHNQGLHIRRSRRTSASPARSWKLTCGS